MGEKTDNFFTVVTVAEILFSKCKILIGTVNKARRDDPLLVKKLKLNLHAQKVSTVHQAKRQKNILLPSALQF